MLGHLGSEIHDFRRIRLRVDARNAILVNGKPHSIAEQVALLSTKKGGKLRMVGPRVEQREHADVRFRLPLD